MLSLRPLAIAAISLATFVVATPAPAQHPLVNTMASTLPRPALADLLTSSSKAAMFYDYLRSSSASLTGLTIAPAPSFTTLFVPVNNAIMALAHKPHRGPVTDVKVEYETDKDEEETNREFLEKWLLRHVVHGDVDENQVYKTYVDGRTVSVEQGESEGEVLVKPGDFRVLDVIEASNGKIILMDGCLDLDH